MIFSAFQTLLAKNRILQTYIIPKLILLIVFVTNGFTAASELTESNLPSYDFISCSMMTSEYLTVLQLYQRGIQEEKALEEIPFSSRGARKRVKQVYALAKNESILDAYSFINSNFARCAKLAHDDMGVPAKDQVDYGYYYCAGENKIRYEIILHTNSRFDLDYVLSKTPDTHMDTAISYFNLIIEKGLLAAFDYTANNLKACIKQL